MPDTISVDWSEHESTSSRVSNSTNVIYGKVHSTTGGQIYNTLYKVGTK